MLDPERQIVQRRKVLYIPGYDPFHPRRYRELYRKESTAQAAHSGYGVTLAPKTGDGPYGWAIDAQIENHDVHTDMQVLVWSDIVKTSMNPSILSTYALLGRTAWTYISTGALFRLMRLRQGPIIAALYPVGFLIVQLLLAVLVAYGIGLGAAMVHPWLWPVGLPMIPVVLWWFRKHDNKFFAYYLMHDYAFSARFRGANPPALEARMAEFCDHIRIALASDAEEVLVVGHSSGAHLTVSVLADLLRSGDVSADKSLSFLSLGQVIPMVSFLPDADRLRADLAFLSTNDVITWVDVTAPGDGCSFALCDPVSVTGVAPDGKRWPLVLSAAFSQTLSPQRWRALKRRYFRLHFQYMCAFDRPGDYDYFRITAGPQTLSDRFSGRKPSKSRIEDAISGYTSQRT